MGSDPEVDWVRRTLKLTSANETSTNAAEFNAGLDDVFTRIAGRYG